VRGQSCFACTFDSQRLSSLHRVPFNMALSRCESINKAGRAHSSGSVLHSRNFVNQIAIHVRGKGQHGALRTLSNDAP
jgi:hypothetical protein